MQYVIDDSAIVNVTSHVYSSFCEAFEELKSIKNKIVVDESELAALLGKNFSTPNLEKLRREGTPPISYIQQKEGGRVMYPSLYLYELLHDVVIGNKAEFIVKQINEVSFIDKKASLLTENQVSKILGISSSTLADYRKKGLGARKIKDKFYTKIDIANWILKSSIKIA